MKSNQNESGMVKITIAEKSKTEDFQSSALNNEEKPYFPEEETHQCLICLLFSPIVPQERLYWANVSMCSPNNTPQPMIQLLEASITIPFLSIEHSTL